MTWPQYLSKYRQFLISIHQAQITTLAAGGALEHFPRNLPERISIGLSGAMRTVAELLLEAANDSRQKIKRTVSAELADDTSPVFPPMLNMYALLMKEGQKPDSVDFQSALYRQQLVMIVAHAEAFFGDSVRSICLAQPGVLESDQKQISWSEALSFHDRQSLLAGLVDNFVGAMMQSKDIVGLLAQLKKTMSLDVKIPAEQAERLSLAEQVRHIIVHNGGRVDRKFLEKTRADLPVGQIYPVNKAFVAFATHAALEVSQLLFSAVAEKYFSIKDPVESVGWRIKIAAATQ